MVYFIGALVALWIIGGTIRHIRRRGKIIRCNTDRCTGCKKCLRYCRHRALEAITDENGTYVFLKYPANCTACGDCLRACKFGAIELVEQKAKEEK